MGYIYKIQTIHHFLTEKILKTSTTIYLLFIVVVVVLKGTHLIDVILEYILLNRKYIK